MTVTPSPSPAPLVRWLTHPGALEARALHRIGEAIGRAWVLWPVAAAAAVPVAALLVAAEVARARQARKGCWVAIAPPAEPDPAGGPALWRMLTPLLRSPGGLARVCLPIGFEYHAGPEGLHVGLWVPPRVPLAGVLKAVESAWPGARATPTAPPELAGGRALACRARLAAPDWLPLGGDASGGGDPIRGVLGALRSDLSGGAALYQVLVRSAARRCLTRARRTARALRSGQATSGLGRALDLLRSRPRARGSTYTDPLALADVRSITAKAIAAPHFEVAVSYRVVSPPGAPRLLGRRSRQARSREIAATLGLYAGRNHLVVRRRPWYGTGVSRRLRRGFLCSLPELAALAHLPGEPARYGLPGAPARNIAPPPEVVRD